MTFSFQMGYGTCHPLLNIPAYLIKDPRMTASKPVFQWEDPFFLDAQLSDEERMVRDAAKAFAEDVLKPRVINDFREESFDPAVMKEMGAIGLLGPTIPETYGGAGLNHVC